MSAITWIIIVVVILIIWLVSQYNGLISVRNRCDHAWAQIDVMLTKRFDLIPNLVEAVKGYAAHEKELFAKIAEARSLMTNATGVKEQAQADNMLSGTLKTLFAVAEAYPELKADTSFLNLQKELSDIETKISYQRQFYNDAVYAFNTSIEQFPGNIVAGMFHFTQKEFFKAEETQRQNVKVQF